MVGSIDPGRREVNPEPEQHRRYAGVNCEVLFTGRSLPRLFVGVSAHPERSSARCCQRWDLRELNAINLVMKACLHPSNHGEDPVGFDLKLLVWTLLVLIGLVGCAEEAPPPESPATVDSLTTSVEPPPEGTPRLILFLVIDQARADYLVRFRPLLKHGLARLLEESVVFTEARHDHAITTTAPGHATLSTGVHPSRHGIVNNWWFDRESKDEVWAVGDDPSPEAVEATALGDWLKGRYPESKVFAASGKDRGAVLTGGKRPDAVYWSDDDDGLFTSSEYYQDDEPAWLVAYHQQRFPDRYFGQVWEPLPEVMTHAEAYGLEALEFKPIADPFPHPLGSASPTPDAGFYDVLFGDTPFGDAYLADFAVALIDGEQLGQDAYPDFLGLGFSALDKVGHGYGPDSPEVLDTLLRLDRLLGDLFEAIDQRIGLDNTLISLSADHGVVPVPEVAKAQGLAARRFGAAEIACFQQVDQRLRARFGDQAWYLQSFYLDRSAVAAAGVDPAELEAETRKWIEECPLVVRAWTRSELEGYAGEESMQRLYANSFHPEHSADILVQLEPFTLRTRSGITTHGSPYDYDRWVPWLLRLPKPLPAVIDEPVFTVDVAPTVAGLVGVTPPSDLDGVDRRPLLPSSH